MKNNYAKLIIILFVMAIFPIISALETTQISYIQKVSYTPYCNTICTNNEIVNSTTNYTTNYTECNSSCYGVFNISLLFAGDDSPRTYEINTSSPLYKSGNDFIVPGVYMATLGNSSDVTGINEKIINLTNSINKNLIECFENNSAIQINSTLVQTTCNAQVASINSELNNKIVESSEFEKLSKQRLYYAIGFFILGIIVIKYGEPYIKGRTTKKDPNEEGVSAYEGRY